MKFSTFANAIGFKSKKDPPLAIQEPPSRRVTSGIDETARYTNRPPAKSSVSSTVQSFDDPIEPQTPTDGARSSTGFRRSMLTTPESDPFSSGRIQFQPAIHDSMRLSVYSNSSMSDIGSKKNDFVSLNRSSYASSLSQSQFQGTTLSPKLSTDLLPASVDATPASSTRSNTPHKKDHMLLPCDVTQRVENVVDLGDLDDDAYTPYPSLYKSGSSSTLTEGNKPPQSDSSQATRLHSRPRGMTDGGSTWSPQSIPDFLRRTPSRPKAPSLPSSPTSFNSPTRPRVLVRQASASRVRPPGTPPNKELPAPPSNFLTQAEVQSALSPVSSTSSLSFASAVSSNRDLPLSENLIRMTEHDLDKASINSKSSASRIVKKAKSHQSFSKRVSNFSSTSSPSIPAEEVIGDKALRKKRSFHNNSRSIMPPLPMPVLSPPPVPSQSQAAPYLSSLEAPPVLQQTYASIPADEVGDRAPRNKRSFHHNARSILPSLPMPARSPPPVPSKSQTARSSSSLEAPTFEQTRSNSTAPSGRRRLFSSGSAKRPSSQIFSPADDDDETIFMSEGERTQETGVALTNSLERTDSPVPPVDNDALSDSRGSPLASADYMPQMIMSPVERLRIEGSLNDGTEDHKFDIPRERVHSFASISSSMSHGLECSSPSVPKHFVVDPASNLPLGYHWYRGELGIPSPLRQALQLSASQANTNQGDPASPSPSSASFPSPSGLPLPPRPRRLIAHNDHEAPVLPLSPPPIRRQNSQASMRSQPVRSVMKKPSFLEIEDEQQQRTSIPMSSGFVGSFLDLERGKDSFDTIWSENDGLG